MSDLVPITQDERMNLWADAFELWISSRQSANTQRVYRICWGQFSQFVGKAPWEVSKPDVARWVHAMQARGLAPSTINQRVMCVRFFYRYAQEEYEVVNPDGSRIPLATSNPAEARSLQVRVQRYEHAVYLSAAEARALLRAIDRQTVRGKRDYALILFYLATGRRNSEVRLLRWGDFEEHGGRMWYRWSGKGKRNRLFECPSTVWEALRDYAQAAGRPGLEDEYIFTALSERARRLPNVGVEWRPGVTPLSMREVGRILKRYVSLAGLDPLKIHVHSLRHTAAMLRKETGMDMFDISKFLAHSNMAITQVYLHELEGKGDQGWSKVEAILGLV